MLEKLRSCEVLSVKERTIHEHGLVSVLRQLHDELDLVVMDAYGWSDLAPLLQLAAGRDAHRTRSSVGAVPAATLPPSGPNSTSVAAGAAPTFDDAEIARVAAGAAPTLNDAEIARGAGDAAPAVDIAATTREDAARQLDEAISERLVALNAERTAEEKRGLVRWLRPAFQNPQGGHAPDQVEINESTPTPVAVAAKKLPWPRELRDLVRAVAAALAAGFSARGRWRERLPTILDTLVAIGPARSDGSGRYTPA